MKNITKILLAITFFLISFEEIEAQVQSCNAMPEPVSYTKVSETTKRVEEYADIKGIRVTRILEVRGNAGDKIMYSNQETHKVTKPIVVNLVRMLLKIRSILLWTLIR